MKPILYRKLGPPDILELVDIKRPEPDAEEVLVKVHAASIICSDWSYVIGKPFMARLIDAGLFKLKQPNTNKRKPMSTRKHQITLVILLYIVLILALVACDSEDDTRITVAEGVQAGDLVDLEPCAFTGIDGDLPADCGTLIVPENRSDPNSRLIALPVTRLKAASATPEGPVFWFSGGPGSKNVIRYPLDGLTDRHEIVMVGYRGVDGQVVLECPEISQAISDAPGTVLSEEAFAAYTTGTVQCVKRLESEGIDLAGYTLTETIDDMEAARKALGYDQVNLYGNSYGSRLQQIYMWRYPEPVNRVVMVSVNPPGHFIWDPAVTDAQIAHYAALCANDAVCSARTDDLVKTMREVKDNMPDRWMGITIDKDAIQLLTYFMMVESIQPDAPVPLSGPAAVDLWLDAAEGDYSGMALISLSKNLFLPNLFTWGHSLSMGFSSGDYRDIFRDFEAVYNPPDALIGAPMSRFFYGFARGWPKHTIDEEFFEVQSSDIETLLVSGSIDFSTPPQFATDALLPFLTNGEQVILEDIGHTESVWSSQPEARAHLITTFLDTGDVDASLYRYQPVDFDAGLGWSGFARILMATVLTVTVLFVALIWLILRRVRRRRAGS